MDIVKSALALLEGEYLREGKVVRQQRERVRDLYELGVVRDDSYATLQVGSITYPARETAKEHRCGRG